MEFDMLPLHKLRLLHEGISSDQSRALTFPLTISECLFMTALFGIAEHDISYYPDEIQQA